MKKEAASFSPRRGLRIVFSYLSRHKRAITLLSLLGVISAITNASVPYVMGSFFDAIITFEGTFHLIIATVPLWMGLLGVWFVLQIFANTSDYIIDIRKRKLGTLVGMHYMAEAVSHIVTLPVSFHKKNRHGDTWDRIIKAHNALESIVQQVIINLAPQFLSILIGIGFAFSIHPPLALVLLAGIAVYVVTLVNVVSPISSFQKKAYKAFSKSFGDAYDVLSNYDTVKQATAESYERTRVFRGFVRRAFKLWSKVQEIWARISALQRIIIILTQLIIFIASVFYIQDGVISIGELIALNGYAAMVFAPFATLGYSWESIQNGLIAIERSEKILRKASENTGRHTQTPPISGDVAFDDVHFSYKKNRNILSGVSLHVQPGEVVALVGKSGVGKSTAVSLISGYYMPTKGDVYIDGTSTKNIDLIHLREHIAVVPQEVVLFNDTIEANIRYGMKGVSRDEIVEACKKAHAHAFIEKFEKGYKQEVGERGVKLSVGEKQRIAIARAILRNPKILILDEPTSALDVETEQLITTSLNELMQGRTTFIIAHRLSTVRKADNIFVFDDGAIVEQGKHTELIERENGVYRSMYDLHIGLHE